TAPTRAKASRRRSLEVENERLPMKSLTAIENLLAAFRCSARPELGRSSGRGLTVRGFTMNRPAPGTPRVHRTGKLLPVGFGQRGAEPGKPRPASTEPALRTRATDCVASVVPIIYPGPATRRSQRTSVHPGGVT